MGLDLATIQHETIRLVLGMPCRGGLPQDEASQGTLSKTNCASNCEMFQGMRRSDSELQMAGLA